MDKLLKIMQELREKCPWDQQQTPMSLTNMRLKKHMKSRRPSAMAILMKLEMN